MHDLRTRQIHSEEIEKDVLTLLYMGRRQRPFGIEGVDVVLHSVTKFLGGHSDLLAGTAHTLHSFYINE